MQLENKTKKPFIVFEGLDGCGKSTQIKMLSRWLNNKNINNILAREPGTTELGEKIRYLLKNYKMSSEAQLMLFNVARSALVDHINANQMTHWVLCDRFKYSTWAYQHYAQNVPAENLLMCEKMIDLKLEPDLVFLFKFQHRIKAKDSFEELEMKKILEGYEKQMNDKWIILPDLHIDALFECIKRIIEEKFIKYF